MADDLTDAQLDAMTRRDEEAGHGHTPLDTEVWQDRHLLLAEVRKLRAANARRRSGRPVSN